MKKTINRNKLEEQLYEERKKHPKLGKVRKLPETTADCPTGPCPYVTCRYHLYLDVTFAGGVKINFPGIEPTDMMFPCALRLAAKEEMTTPEIGKHLNEDPGSVSFTMQRGVKKLRKMDLDYLDPDCDNEPDLRLVDILEVAKKEVA